jgi:hypothetical protein
MTPTGYRSPEYYPLIKSLGCSIVKQNPLAEKEALTETVRKALVKCNQTLENSTYRIQLADKKPVGDTFYLELINNPGVRTPLYRITPKRPDGFFCKTPANLSEEILTKVKKYLEILAIPPRYRLFSDEGSLLYLGALKTHTVWLDLDNDLVINGKKVSYEMQDRRIIHLNANKIKCYGVFCLISHPKDPALVYCYDTSSAFKKNPIITVIHINTEGDHHISREELTPSLQQYLDNLSSPLK